MSGAVMMLLWVLHSVLDCLLLVDGGRIDHAAGDRPSFRQTVLAEVLHCFQCRHDRPGCLTLANISQIPVVSCRLDQPHCMVQRIESRGELTGLERRCAATCSPGCKSTFSLRKCTSCCNTSLCNVDSAAWRLGPSHLSWLLIGLLCSTAMS